MQPGVATHDCLAARRAVSCLLLLLGLGACSSAPARFEPGALTAAQVELCRAAEKAYREQAADYPQKRAAAAADPVAAAWLVRMFLRDLFVAREGQPLGEDQPLFRAAARVVDPVETRALAELRTLGAVAVPTLVGDLLLHSQPQPRELGIELLAMIGAPAVPALQEVARTGETRPRRAAARALGGIGLDDRVLATLRTLAGDSDYTVRADALRSLRGGGEAARTLLTERLAGDPDPFVRRVAAETLGHAEGRAVMLALADYLERCQKEADHKGEVAAQLSLQRIANSSGLRSVADWRTAANRVGAPR